MRERTHMMLRNGVTNLPMRKTHGAERGLDRFEGFSDVKALDMPMIKILQSEPSSQATCFAFDRDKF